MSEKIQTKTFNYGNECEAEWPPRFPENPKGVVGYWDSKEKKFVEGYPKNPNNYFGSSAAVIADSIAPQYHEDAKRVISSRKEWDAEDAKHNRLCFGTREEISRHTKKGVDEEQKAIKADRRKANLEARQEFMENPKQVKDRRAKKAEAQMEVIKKSGLETELKKQGVKI